MRTLAALVPAAVEGVLRDLTIAAASGIEGLERIADHAGCELVEAATAQAALVTALKGTRENNVFLIRAGRAPETGFADELAELIGEGARMARMRERPDTFLQRLMPSLAPAAALLAPREKLVEIASEDMVQLSRRLGNATAMRSRARRVD